MKKYFDFRLTGTKFLHIWLIFYFVVILPYAYYYIILVEQNKSLNPNPLIGIVPLVIIIAAFLISFYIIKVSIENIYYQNSSIKFEGKFDDFLGVVLLGFIFSLLTLTIYAAWFVKNLVKFFANNSAVNGSNFKFQGKGGKLFIFVLVAAYLPFILLTVFFYKHIVDTSNSLVYSILHQVIGMIILIPYTYLLYNWMVNLKFKDYEIKWQTKFGESCLKILAVMLLIILTFGIYMPLGYLKLYKYFAEKTIVKSLDRTMYFGYDLDAKNDFLFIWGQIILTILTIGFYYPWAYSKIGKRVLTKTFIKNNNAA